MTDLVLSHDRLVVRVIPERGAVISSITIDGVEVLAQMPWTAGPLPVLPDEPAWVRAWAGGWNVLLPNAGQPSEGTPTHQGFHGSASVSPWTVERHTQHDVLMTWTEAGLSCRRRVRLEDQEVRATSTLTNEAEIDWPVVVTEHAILGSAVLAHPAHITADETALLAPLAYDGRPTGEPAVHWPGDGWDVVDTTSPARVAALSALGDRGIRVASRDLMVDITWSTASLPYAWIWQEVGVSAESPWNGEVFALGIEPSTCPHGAGVDAAVADGTAVILNPGTSLTWWTALRVDRTTGQ